MTLSASVLAAGAAAGRLRVPVAEIAAAWGPGGGRGTVAVAGPDEDPLTLAWEAATTALAAGDLAPDTIGGLWWGCARPPFAEGPSHALLATALGLPATVAGTLLAGSTHAGADALVAALAALEAGLVETALVVASDALVPGTGTSLERRAGSGAAALVVGRSADGGPATVTFAGSWSHPYLGRYRGDGEAATRDVYDARLYREEVFLPAVATAAGAATAHRGTAPTRWAVPDPDGRLGRAAAKAAGATEVVSADASARLGDTGAAEALLGLVAAAATAGTAAAVAHGSGRTSAWALEVTEPVPGAGSLATALEGGRPASYAEALRSREQLVAAGEGVPMGVPPGSAMFVRGAEEMLQLLGGRCAECGTISTPPSIHPTCVGCGSPKLEPVALARTGVVHTYVVNQTMPAPFEAPLPLVVVDLADGARLMLQGSGDGSDLQIGAPVTLTLRRYARERGVPVYGYKVVSA